MRWLFARHTRPPAPAAPRPPMAHPGPPPEPDGEFICSTCGRSDLPETGGWDPPICLECDAAINFDAEMEMAWRDDRD